MKIMKANWMTMLLAVLLIGGQSVWAQHKPGKAERPRITPEQMMQKQSRRMAKALLLDDATAAKFMPVYENYLKELRECRMEGRKEMAGPAAVKEEAPAPEVKALPTDAEIEKQIKDGFARSRKMLDIREKYFDEFSKFLTPQQIQKIYKPGRRNAMHRGAGLHRPGKVLPGHCPAHRAACQPCPQGEACPQ